jgi:putative ABC transport system permease protein
MSRWRVALRIARRTVRRSPARSLLIALLVAVPVAGATYADIMARTFGSPEREAQRTVGSADAAVTATARKRIAYDPRWLVTQSSSGRLQRQPADVDVKALLPAVARSVEMPRTGPIALQRGEGIVRSQVIVGDVREPLHQHLVRLEQGRAPGAGEALLTRELALRMKLLDGDALRSGASIALAGEHTGAAAGAAVRVTGIVRNPTCLSCEQVVVAPGSALVKPSGPGTNYFYGLENPTYLVDLPDGISVDALGRELAAGGVALTTREALAHPERYPAPPGFTQVDADSVRALALVAVIVALGLLEVVLLAGTAFAVGARRQTRELGLVAASGGGPRDVRRIVLAQGLVLGALGAALGVAAGSAVAIAGRPLWERLADAEIAGWSFGPWEIFAGALVGLLSGLAAAVLPAIGAARMRPVNALAGRFRIAGRTRRRSTLAGVALVVVGVACGLIGGALLSDDFSAYEEALAGVAQSGRYLESPAVGDAPLLLLIGGTVFAIVGVVLLAAPLIGWLARSAARLPLTARLAVRDAERHRHRTGPATGAIALVVTGSVALAFLLAGQFRADELRHVPALPAGMLAVERGEGSEQAMLRAAGVAAAELPGARVQSLDIPLGPPQKGAPPDLPDDARALIVNPPSQPDCPAQRCGFAGGDGTLAIARDDALTRRIAGSGYDGAARRALLDGKLLVFDASLLDRDGTVSIALDGRDVRMPGVVVDRSRAYGLFPSALVSARAAQARGWDVGQRFVFVSFDERASRDVVDSALTRVEQAGAFAVYDTGPDNPENLAMVLIAAAAAFVTLIGVAISVALSAAEGRADLATLAAVGAAPRRRRALMAGQALLVGGLGCVLGVALGTFVGYTARATTGSPELVVPWVNLAITAIGVPLLAAAVAALCTRSRLPMVRRLD